MKIGQGQAGFIPGMAIEINISIAVLGIVFAVLWSWSLFPFSPLSVEPIKAELVAPGVATPAMPEHWRVTQDEGGAAVIRFGEPAWQSLILPVLLLAAIIALFVAPLQWPYWLLLACLGGAWGYGITLGPGSQQVKIAPDGTVEVRSAARFAWLVLKGKTLAAHDVETVLVHKTRPEAYVVFRAGDDRRGWRLYTDEPAEAHAVAAAVRARLKPPPAAATSPDGGKK